MRKTVLRHQKTVFTRDST